MEFQIPITPETLRLVAQLDHFRGVWASGTHLPPDRLARLRDASRVKSVAASSRLAGVRVSDTEVAALLRGETCPVREGAEILGYAEAMDRSFPSMGPIVTTEEIRRLNAVLHGCRANPPEPSPWREHPLHLEAFDADGKALGRVFQTLPPRLVSEKAEDLVTWLELELHSDDTHPLLVIATFVLAFMAASPFARGNGRTARLLAGHLLRRVGHSHLPYASFEGVMEEMREDYYHAFDAGETRLWTGKADLEPWLRFFLDVLRRHSERVAAKIDLERRALDFTPLQRAILDTVRGHGTAAAALLLASTGTNRNTLKDNLRKLVDEGVLERLGRRRGTFYRLATGEAPRAEPDEK